jgi:hypothetical protein
MTGYNFSFGSPGFQQPSLPSFEIYFALVAKMSSTNDTFKAILSDFKKRLTPDEQENFQFATLKDVRETALRIQRDQEQLKTMMNMARLESFLEAMDQFGKVIEVFVNASSFVAFIWGPMKFILQVRRRASSSLHFS